ncbi:hypothetical protein E1A91_A03G129800v1 [Gossypium mustelinum]|uniref:Uncharacterized protein n=4 Tax=Gossypium TaxID=3633 RepID=A0ABR0QJK0_GOSAR|nr:uncharacterized protein LOC108488940 [Gossypium arboreum]XP_052882348.1 uncharacterized protein LOC108488940 [Gossypium arboreum]TYH25086.1 hypothetical protein ES288_A03G141100v1 [Gossypium darwinii]TYI36411.1 hypothetical protein ES332_A03G139300v1 [Gossypium tomentosum]TYJ43085.1 hypothetical protein E1A91_A03G129800v1 [Gossypium mustelinum]KAK5839162.1 hypothetical protein PVK06_007930 [Gossypium arboreum]TYI36412.1 hypothetical protein ES332_A03G139300v1 [Gossypium tomentosum]
MSLVERLAGLRVIKYEANGKLFVSAGNDKLVKVWSTESWLCIATVCSCSEKRASALAIRNDGLHVCLADKFVVVRVVNLSGVGGTRRSSQQEGSAIACLLLYYHY